MSLKPNHKAPFNRVAYAVSARVRRQLRAGRAGAVADRGPGSRDRDGPQARRNAARHPPGNPGDQPETARARQPRQRRGLLALRAEPYLQRGDPRPRLDLLSRRRRRLLLVHRGRLLRDLPRRAAAHPERAAARSPPRRHRAHRGAAGTAGHAVWLELPVRDAALHHEQAGPDAYSTSDVEPGRPLGQGRRRGLRRFRRLNLPLGEDVAIRVVGFSARDAGFIDNVLGESLGGTFDNADWSTRTSTSWNTWAAARPSAGCRTRTGPWMPASSTSKWTRTATRKTTSCAPAASTRSCASSTRAARTNGRSSR